MCAAVRGCEAKGGAGEVEQGPVGDSVPARCPEPFRPAWHARGRAPLAVSGREENWGRDGCMGRCGGQGAATRLQRGGGGRPEGEGVERGRRQHGRRGTAPPGAPRVGGAGAGRANDDTRGARDGSTRWAASAHEGKRGGGAAGSRGRQELAGQVARVAKQQAPRCTEERGGRARGIPQCTRACVELRGRCRRARDRQRHSGCRAGGPRS